MPNHTAAERKKKKSKVASANGMIKRVPKPRKTKKKKTKGGKSGEKRTV